MSGVRETELKFDASEAALAQLAASPLLRETGANHQSTRLKAVYFDTRSWKLRQRGLSLRVREREGRHIQTLKRIDGSPSVVMQRDEWEADVPGPAPDPSLPGCNEILREKDRARLRPRFETAVTREAYALRHGAADFELAIDRGMVTAGKRSAPICEIELELKRGDIADVFAFARAIAAEVPLRLSTTSKADRGYALARGGKPTAVRAIPVIVDPACNNAEAFQICARACLQQVVANQYPVLGRDPEGIHQARVGLRRLRAAISIFGNMLGDSQSGAIRQDLRWITRALGLARDLDVFVARIVSTATDKDATEGFAALTRDLKRMRHDAFNSARAAFESDRFRALLLNVAAWIECGDWLNDDSPAAVGLRAQPVTTLAAAEMARRRRKILRRGRALQTLSPDRRHRVRLQVKKLRYAAEFFAATIPDGPAARRRQKTVAALETMQGALGDLNDIAMHESLFESLAMPRGRAARRDREALKKSYAAGRFTGREEAYVADRLAEAKKALADFAKVRPFWT